MISESLLFGDKRQKSHKSGSLDGQIEVALMLGDDTASLAGYDATGWIDEFF